MAARFAKSGKSNRSIKRSSKPADTSFDFGANVPSSTRKRSGSRSAAQRRQAVKAFAAGYFGD